GGGGGDPRWGGGPRRRGRRVARVARALDRPARVLDVAAGAGDVLRRLARRSRRAGLGLVLEGCDVSPVALAHARRRAEEEKADLRFFACDVLREPLPAGYDAVVCSLFLHHLSAEQAVGLLRRMAAARSEERRVGEESGRRLL